MAGLYPIRVGLLLPGGSPLEWGRARAAAADLGKGSDRQVEHTLAMPDID